MKTRILFLCTGNSCRSQMAEAWTKSLKGDSIEAWSAGVEAQGLNPNAVRVMSECSINISRQHSKTIKELAGQEFDYVITVCDAAAKSCPRFPGKPKIIHHTFDDPPALAKDIKNESEALKIYRRVRDEIKDYVMTLPGSLKPS